ncbi:SNF1-related protein kinase regulatory subunit beta-2 isoform X1 [Cinnamomum micranthum f. kanehirae]|uniref:SNF1-related protein kinase regulatory subunit beta-2 isoform X1 n=1 Tax=Cinnamomum micranthum f. kanehirae TaxID=337451 RepID=A0A443NXM0_9MAGN|nr:SNF1-related protein kinase regulatory subunit beta-2 isoform X1 [Cinnamomum micranthum f. kanehirae]
MGNASVRGEGGNSTGIGVGDEQFHSSYLAEGGSQEMMGQSPPHSPRTVVQTPLMFTPQVPMAPLPRPDEMHTQSHAWTQNVADHDAMICEQGIPTMITWSYGGKEVAVEGSWDDWKTKKLLQRSGKDFTIMKVLPPGVYQFRFIVDGEWKYAPDIQWMHDDLGNAYNILDLQDFVPEDLDSVAGFEPPQSPESSYNNMHPGSEDYAKEPPLAPSHLQLTLLNTPSYMDSPAPLSRPQHVVLNHLYVQKGKTGQSVVALGATHRFRAKYVTVVLYKSMQR